MEKYIILLIFVSLFFLYILYKKEKQKLEKNTYVFMNCFCDLLFHSKSPEEAISIISDQNENIDGIFSRKLKKILLDAKTTNLPSALRINAKKTHIAPLTDVLNTIAFSIDCGGTNTGQIITKRTEHFELINELKKKRIQSMFFTSVFILFCGAVIIPGTVWMSFYFYGQYSIDALTKYFIAFIAAISSVFFSILREDYPSAIFLAPICICIASFIIAL